MTIHFDIGGNTPPPLPPARGHRRASDPIGGNTIHVRFSQYVARPFRHVAPALFAISVAVVLGFAWWQREEGTLTAESGLGYWLGIIGGVLMLLLFAYPIRKRFPAFRRFGRVANWFRFHMIIGIIGPTLVILHTNFKLGSLNSRLALFTMLTVVASGIVGRYLYTKVHRGLYGQQLALCDVHADVVALGQLFRVRGIEAQEIEADLRKYLPRDKHDQARFNLTSSVFLASSTRASRRRILRRLNLQLCESTQRVSRRQRRQHLKEADTHLRLFFAAVRKAETFSIFEALLGMWHHLHMPLFAMLFLTVVLHIVAVHLY